MTAYQSGYQRATEWLQFESPAPNVLRHFLRNPTNQIFLTDWAIEFDRGWREAAREALERVEEFEAGAPDHTAFEAADGRLVCQHCAHAGEVECYPHRNEDQCDDCGAPFAFIGPRRMI